MSNSKKEILSYLDNVTLFIWGAIFFVFPFIFTTLTTDPFTFPKQIILAIAVVITVLIHGVKMIIEGKIRLRTTPFDLPLLVFTIVLFLSAFFAINRYDAYIAFVPVLFAILSYYSIVNLTNTKNTLLFLLGALVAGASVSSILTILTFFKIYVLPYQYTHAQAFTPFGSLLDQAMYLALILPVAGHLAYPLFANASQIKENELLQLVEKKTNQKISIGFAAMFVFIAAGLGTTLTLLLTTQKPLILPIGIGFQTAFAVISQDAGRLLQSFLFGSGFGTYLTVFSRFKQAAYNLNPELWSFTFFRSSSFILELLATTGLLGFLSFGLILVRIIKEKHYFIPLILAIVAAIILPFSFTIIALFFLLLALFASIRTLQDPRKYAEIEFYFVALRHGLLAAQTDGQRESTVVSNRYSKFLPVSFFVLIVLILGALSYISSMYIFSDLLFQRAIVAASQNNGGQTYQLQRDALGLFGFRDFYYRSFAQTNLALANSLATAQPTGASPSAEVQNQIIQLIQQSINAGRAAVTVSPQTAANWNNLSSIYRSLIGFGQNADQFAVLTNQQAIALDPNNPQQYIALGGIYYQLGLWDDAQRQFSSAIQAKPDYANAYYNLGHAFESKNDLNNALLAYQQVKALVANDKEGVKKISEEIDMLQKKIGGQAGAQAQTPQAATTSQTPLEVSKPAAQLPERDPKVKIPGPTVSPIPSPTDGPAVSPTGNPSPTKTP